MPELYLPSNEDFNHRDEDFFSEYETKERRYLHFDRPSQRKEVRKVSLEKFNEKHRFYPLIGYKKRIRKIHKKEDGRICIKEKERPIRYASHRDADYLEVYSHYLGRKYEYFLSNEKLSECVLAYRKGGGTNIHHAYSLFKEIEKRRDCIAIALDITKFFDSINHIILKQKICRITNEEYLDDHHGNIWKNMTKYSWIELDEIDKDLGKNRKKPGRICDKDGFNRIRGKKKGLVKRNSKPYGIPQGTPISGLYANIYLIDFDLKVSRICKKFNSVYRRYSDDIAIIAPYNCNPKRIEEYIRRELKKHKLEMSDKKTEISKFKNGKIEDGKPFQYLGFTYDGIKKLIRESTLNAYRAKMQRAIRAKLHIAKSKGIKKNKIYKRKLIRKYTHLGKGRNFIKYAYRAAEIMKSGDIRKQVKNHMKWFNRAWERELKKIYGP